ncbi:hypothetical protein ACHAWO_004226 [Cyclotella atomus]|uniref:SAM-dependent MTase RsmB/NOP-type domain-containing protein n=1 Tax=Cyclotella atomus TaxID=382360 RepID=A0ABD3QPA7_9STRA
MMRPSRSRNKLTVLILLTVCITGSTVSSFIQWSPLLRICSARSVVATKKVDNELGTIDDSEIRDEAALALLPVLFPGYNETAYSKLITAETALKKLLKSRYSTAKSGSKARDSGRVAALVLGTSVMRLRHWYLAAGSCSKAPPVPYPLDSSILALLRSICYHPVSVGERYSHDELLSFTKSMVDEHAKYLSQPETSIDLDPDIANVNPALKLSLQYSVPIFISDALLKHYGQSITKEIFMQSNAPGPITIRKNSLQFPGSDEDLCQYILDEDEVHPAPMRNSDKNALQSESKLSIRQSADGMNRFILGAEPAPGTIASPKGCISIHQKPSKSIWSMKAWQQGYFEVQDAGSQIIVASLEAKPGDSILDYCAGNGGKSFGIASTLMEGRGTSNSNVVSRIVSHDVVDERLRQIKGSMSRVGFTELFHIKTSPGTRAFSTRDNVRGISQIRIANSTQLAEIKPNKFDIVLVDAPCSSTGVLRRRPSQRWILTKEEVFENLPKLQLEILLKAALYVKSGGKLVYSTCSLLREENEDVVAAFEQSDIFKRSFQRWSFDTNSSDTVNSDNVENSLTLLPSDNNDGFFIARWKTI